MPTKLHFLVTAGSTRQKIDDVRDWGNIFTGQTGLDLALAFLKLGNVTLLTSNTQHAQQYDGHKNMTVETFRSHEDLRALLMKRMMVLREEDRVDVVAMTAAVSDYNPEGTYRIVSKSLNAEERETWLVENVSAGKVKSHFDEIAVRGIRTEKLIDLFRSIWNFKGTLIKFKLEVGISEEELIKIATASRTASDADLIVANTLAMAKPTQGDGGGGAAYLIDNVETLRVARGELAQRVANWVKAKRLT